MNDLLVIVPTTNLELVKGTLDALHAQTFKDFEVLLIANGTSQDEAPWLQRDFPFVELHTIGERIGFAAAVNIGIRTTENPLLLLLNDDAQPKPDCLAHLMEAQEEHSNYDAFATKICFFYSPSVIESAGDGFSLAGRGFHRAWRERDAPPYDEETEVFGACAAAALYRRRLFDGTGLFEEEFYAIHEDVDLAFRARRKGFRFLYVPKAKVLHKGSSTLGKKSRESVYLDSRNSELLLLKNFPFFAFLKILPWYLLYNYYYLIQAWRRSYLFPFLKGKVAIYGKVGKMLRKGALIELEAEVPFAELRAHFDDQWHWQGISRALNDWRAVLAALALPALFLLALILRI